MFSWVIKSAKVSMKILYRAGLRGDSWEDPGVISSWTGGAESPTVFTSIGCSSSSN